MKFSVFLFWFFIVEYIFICLTILAIFIFDIFLLATESLQKSREDRVKKLIKDLLNKNLSIQKLDLKNSRLTKRQLLQILESFDQKFSGADWQAIKNHICDQELLPKARKLYKSILWIRRSLAARIFLLSCHEADFSRVYKLLRDRDFFIRMLAVSVLAKEPSRAHVEILLTSMAKEKEQARFTYRHAILEMPLESLRHVVEIYQNAQEEEMRLVCLDILSRKFFTKFYQSLSKDYDSKNTKVRVFVVRILGNFRSDASIEDLIRFLDDPATEVKIEAIRMLKKIRSENSFDKLASLLRDSDENVRLEAALALKNFGLKGRQFLEMQDWDIEPNAYHAARYVLTLP